MKSFTYLVCAKQLKKTMLFAVLATLFGVSVNAQSRPYSIIYSDNIQGSTVMFGNTLMAIYNTNNQGNNTTVNSTRMNDNSANGTSTNNSGNDGSNMGYVDIDGNSGAGAGTRNSSSADLNLPAGVNNIKWARLYWGGRVTSGTFDLTQVANQKIKLRKGTSGSYYEFTASQLDKNTSGTITQYQAYADVTQSIKDNGAGTYTVGNAPLTTGSVSGGGNYGGWCIIVAYENTTEFTSYNAVRIYDGFRNVASGVANTYAVTLTNLNVPSGALALRDAKMGVMTWEGDANITGDYLKINGTTFSNGVNQSNNPWNGTISDSGTHVHSKNPDYTNQMALDIDQFYVGTGYGILPNANSVNLEFGTETDQYFPGLFTFVIKTKDPLVLIDKFVADANNNHVAQAGEVLTYTIKGKNVGEGNGSLTVVTDTLPGTVTYIPGTLNVVSSPGVTAGIKTDGGGDDIADFTDGASKVVVFRLGANATSSTGGVIAPGETFEITFQVTVNTPVSGIVPPILNTARVITTSDNSQIYIDYGSVGLEPQGGPLPVTLKSFTAALQTGTKTKIDWATSMEINCSSYEIERSADGRMFSKVATVAGNGNSAVEHAYSIVDDVTAITSSVVYYRLKQVDVDGRRNYSKVISIKLKKDTKNINVSPNPFSSYLNVNLDWSKTETSTVKVFNVLGKEVVSKNVQLTKGLNYITLDELSSLPSGNYLIQINSGEERIVKKITKQ